MLKSLDAEIFKVKSLDKKKKKKHDVTVWNFLKVL